MDTKPQGLDGEFARRFIKVMSRANVWVYRRTGGRLGGTWRVGSAFRKPVRICLMEHRGRRTGLVRTTPLIYLRDGADVVVVASQAGRPQHPLWFHNVVANPEVTLHVGAERLPMAARTANPDERARLWPLLVALYADYANYQSWCEREIPVVVCSPR